MRIFLKVSRKWTSESAISKWVLHIRPYETDPSRSNGELSFIVNRKTRRRSDFQPMLSGSVASLFKEEYLCHLTTTDTWVWGFKLAVLGDCSKSDCSEKIGFRRLELGIIVRTTGPKLKLQSQNHCFVSLRETIWRSERKIELFWSAQSKQRYLCWRNYLGKICELRQLFLFRAYFLTVLFSTSFKSSVTGSFILTCCRICGVAERSVESECKPANSIITFNTVKEASPSGAAYWCS